mgnify:CR=1 FL=1
MIEKVPTVPLGKINSQLPLTGIPQPRGALVISSASWEVEHIVARLRSLDWEVLQANGALSVPASTTSAERARDSSLLQACRHSHPPRDRRDPPTRNDKDDT